MESSLTIVNHLQIISVFNSFLYFKQVPPIDEWNPGISMGMYEMAAGLVQEFDNLEIKDQG